jgi:hypothetical protein
MIVLRLECSCFVYETSAVLPHTRECTKEAIIGTTEA